MKDQLLLWCFISHLHFLFPCQAFSSCHMQRAACTPQHPAGLRPVQRDKSMTMGLGVVAMPNGYKCFPMPNSQFLHFSCHGTSANSSWTATRNSSSPKNTERSVVQCEAYILVPVLCRLVQTPSTPLNPAASKERMQIRT